MTNIINRDSISDVTTQKSNLILKIHFKIALQVFAQIINITLSTPLLIASKSYYGEANSREWRHNKYLN